VRGVAPPATFIHLHHLQLPPPPSPGSSACGRGAHPALLGPCALQRRLCTLSIGLLPASCVAGDVVAVPFASSRRTYRHAFPRCSSVHASAALAWQAVAVDLRSAVESLGRD
jgi:hypothetical protein